jgi:hypothetical protein
VACERRPVTCSRDAGVTTAGYVKGVPGCDSGWRVFTYWGVRGEDPPTEDDRSRLFEGSKWLKLRVVLV